MDENKGLSMGALTAAVVTSSIGSGVFTLTSSLAVSYTHLTLPTN